jgi:hypothetical protein
MVCIFAPEQEDFEQLFEAVELPQFVGVLVHSQLHQLLPALPTNPCVDHGGNRDVHVDEIHDHGVVPLQTQLMLSVIMPIETFS